MGRNITKQVQHPGPGHGADMENPGALAYRRIGTHWLRPGNHGRSQGGGNLLLMRERKATGVAWLLSALLAGLVLAALVPFGVWLRWYRIARYHGTDADLRGAWLPYAPLAHADLSSANLRGATLTSANLTAALLDADLTAADLRHARLEAASLSDANLPRARLSGARLVHADLCNTDCRGADFSRSDITGVDLSMADLRSENFAAARLRAVKLDSARYDVATRWPAGFDPQQHGALLIGRGPVSVVHT
jgi:Pentapeptide repeats (8 copies)